MSSLERRIMLTPAWDRSHPDPRQNYGIHGVELQMYLVGPGRAVQFKLYTGWHWIKSPSIADLWPIPADFGFHSPTPQYDGQEVIADACEFVGGQPCYYDGSGLNAERVYERLLREGSDGVWAELEAYYHELFDPAAKE